MGVVDIATAMKAARDENLDLVELVPEAKPPVCKIMDYKHFLYDQKQKAKEAKKNQSFGSRLISWFWYLFVPIGFYFLIVDPIILILMIGFVILMAYIRNLTSKVLNASSVGCLDKKLVFDGQSHL